MKKIFKLNEVDCPNCAAKMEREINKLDEIENASVSYLTQKLIVEADEINDILLDKIQELIKKIEPDCKIVR